MTPLNYPYFFAKAIDNIRNNLFINIVAVAIIAASFLIFNAFIMLFGNINSFLKTWQKGIQIEAYMKPGLGDNQIDGTMESIMTISGVEKIRYISKDEALREFTENLGTMDFIVRNLEDNPLPSSFEVTLEDEYKNFNTLEKIAKKINNLESVSDVVYGRDWVNRFSTFIGIFRIIGIIIACFLLLATVTTVSNTIKLTVYSRKEELEVMKLLGAGNSFIRLPFFMEGLVQGFLGALMSLIILYVIYILFVSGFTSSLTLPMLTNRFHMAFLSPATIVYILIGGMALGLFGSFISLGRFLRV